MSKTAGWRRGKEDSGLCSWLDLSKDQNHKWLVTREVIGPGVTASSPSYCTLKGRKKEKAERGKSPP